MPKDKPMKAKSKSQRRLFGWASACVNDPKKDCPTQIKKLGNTFKEKYPEDLKSLAKTKHAGLPERKKKKKNENILSFGQFNESNSEKGVDIGSINISVPLKDIVRDEYAILVEFEDGSLLEYNYSSPGKTDYFENFQRYSDVTGWSREDIDDTDDDLDPNLKKQITDWFHLSETEVKNIRKIYL